MKDSLLQIFRSATEFSPSEIIGGLGIGLVLALICTGIYSLAHKKLSDPTPLLCGLVLVGCSLSMALGAAYILKAVRTGARVGMLAPTATRDAGPVGPRGGRREGPPPPGRIFVREADRDGDGRLTPEEAAEFVRQVDIHSKGWVDANDIDNALRTGVIRPAPVALQPPPPLAVP